MPQTLSDVLAMPLALFPIGSGLHVARAAGRALQAMQHVWHREAIRQVVHVHRATFTKEGPALGRA
jgi:ATP-dependent protease HslVU (ClpYQ) peptidase subunit